MRRALVLLLLLSCSKGDDKAKPGGEPAPGSPPSGGQSDNAERGVKGTVTFGGAMTATMSWKPDLNLTCSCIEENSWGFDVTVTDGAGGAAALEVHHVKDSPDTITLTSGKLPTPEPLRASSGFTGRCKLDNLDTNGVMAIDLDTKVTGKAGEVTIKGHLDIVCRARR